MTQQFADTQSDIQRLALWAAEAAYLIRSSPSRPWDAPPTLPPEDWNTFDRNLAAIETVVLRLRTRRAANETPSLVCGHAECIVSLPCKREAPEVWHRAGTS